VVHLAAILLRVRDVKDVAGSVLMLDHSRLAFYRYIGNEVSLFNPETADNVSANSLKNRLCIHFQATWAKNPM
jgi:hypothetical protein